MALKEFHHEAEGAQKERIIIYGQAGVGKSRFALAVPRDDYWGEILLYAADEGSEFLQSVSPAMRKGVHVLVPSGDNPIVNFQEFCVHDWRKEYPNVKTLVVDTYTKVTRDSIQHSANSGAVTAEKHFTVGDPLKGGQVIPNRGDYMAIESLSQGYLSSLFQHQAHFNIILLCQEDIKVVEGVAQSVGGPAHPGRAMAQELPAKVSTVIRLIREPLLLPGNPIPQICVFAITTHNGQYIAKLRECAEGGNPMPRTQLDINPVNFWTKYNQHFAPQVRKES